MLGQTGKTLIVREDSVGLANKLWWNLDPPEMKQQFRDNPEYYLKYCKAIESELNVRFKLIVNDTPEAIEAKEVSSTTYQNALHNTLQFSIREMSRKLAGREDLTRQIVPTTFNVGCRRPTPGNG